MIAKRHRSDLEISNLKLMSFGVGVDKRTLVLDAELTRLQTRDQHIQRSSKFCILSL
jgi:hypothetical protein